VILDLITVKYILSYFASPMKLFGQVGIGFAVASCGGLMGTLLMKLIGGVDMTGNPLLMLSVFCMMASIQFFSLGLLGEVNARIYYGTGNRHHYAVREYVNFDEPSVSHELPLRRAA
jgi:hypothetical protein